ncbi:hypothetical protein LMG27952_03103 [Paraburkholderia hiiakae]|uniref:Phage integrase family protein n=1 Tax=Paraburkholderia hiiakae TaxID=1081782 RepID=A0ABM8NP55_9BURK|nr:hypothetical protein [Paraburkholderia hiiakae]CAD6536071.1 hypothetical protein LMG27952_03103 [Paraburkholderia hiiakae]
MGRTSRHSPKSAGKNEPTGIDRLYKRTGVRKVSFWYKFPDGRSETFETAVRGDRAAIHEAERRAKRRAVDVQEGQIIAGSVADAIDRFRTEYDVNHFRDQSRDGKYVRESYYEKLTRFFGKMAPARLETIHGYQYLDARAAAGAPMGANKELALMQTMCNYWIRWGLIKINPFVGMMLNQGDPDVRTVTKAEIVPFYLWAVRQPQAYRTMGVAAMFTYLTGFRAAEVRPFHMSGLTEAGVRVISAKRKKGEAQTVKLREWSMRLRTVVERAKRDRKVASIYLFPNRRGQAYSKSGWTSVWQDAMYAYIGEFDPAIAREFEAKCKREAAQRRGEKADDVALKLVEHPAYFALSDVRPAAITAKLEARDADAYDFAAHANPSTTHKHYDRRKVRRASATE